MELIATDDYFILQAVEKGETNLWCSRRTGRFEVRPSWDLAGQENPECLGLVWALYGKLSVHPELLDRLVLVRHCERVAELPGADLDKHPVYKVTSVVLLPISPPAASAPDVLAQQLQLKPCLKHHVGLIQQPDFQPTTAACDGASKATKPFGKIATKLSLNSIKSNVATALSAQVPWKAPNRSVPKSLERYERRVVDEVLKLFNDSNSFYFSPTWDVTNSLQRQNGDGDRVNDRFFFNESMVRELVEVGASGWVTPFIQGHVEVRECPLEVEEEENGEEVVAHLPSFYSIAVVSRRSRHRAGTRYKRRGVDDDGHVANYVETEQILSYHRYALSFVQVRGSVPVFWSQPGYKYRPPPRLDRSAEESGAAFAKHFDSELAAYGAPVHCVSLAERSGREKVISDAYFDQALGYDNPDLTFVSFDFHDACRGMHFERVSTLTDAVEELLRAVRYAWLDSHGMVCAQNGVFRMNCVDCLDRTNVVQTAVARLVLENQLTKLGVTMPEQPLPEATRTAFQALWANNGDALSRQYAGTNALKGDFTRTGERNLTGLVKDGMNSASRYYLNQFRDAYRQVAIDLITGQIVGDSLNVDREEEEEESCQEDESPEMKAERVMAVVNDCKRLLIPDLGSVVGSWGVIDGDPVTGDPSEEDMDVIFILTRDSYYFVNYDDDVDKVTRYQRVSFQDVEGVEFGAVEESAFQMAFRRGSAKSEPHLRISYCASACGGGFFHMVRSSSMRFFNNLAQPVRTDEERSESLRSIAEALVAAMDLAGCRTEVAEKKLEKRRSKIPDGHSNFNEVAGSSPPPPPRGRTNLQAFKGASSRAFSNVTSQFSKLNPLSKLKQKEDPDDCDSPPRNECSLSNSPSNSLHDHDDGPSALLAATQPPAVASGRATPIITLEADDDDDDSAEMEATQKSRISAQIPQEEEVVDTLEGKSFPGVDSEEPAALNPFTKLTKGIQNAVLSKKGNREEAAGAVSEIPVGQPASSSLSRSASSQAMDYMSAKLGETSSLTKVIIL